MGACSATGQEVISRELHVFEAGADGHVALVVAAIFALDRLLVCCGLSSTREAVHVPLAKKDIFVRLLQL